MKNQINQKQNSKNKGENMIQGLMPETIQKMEKFVRAAMWNNHRCLD